MIPAFGSAGTNLAGSNSTTASVPVPANVAMYDVILVPFYVEVAQAVTPSAGFAEAPNSPVIVSPTQMHYLHVFWKRAVAADTGTYAWTVAAGLTWRSGTAMRISGCVRTGSPFDVTTSTFTTTSGTTAPAVSLTTTGPNRLLAWCGSSFSGGTVTTPPTGFTSRFNPQSYGASTLFMPDGGPTGSLTATWSGSGGMGVWLGALEPAPVPNVMETLSVPLIRSACY